MTEIFDFYEKGKWIELYENCESCELTFEDDRILEVQYLRLNVWCENLDSAPDVQTVSKLFDEIVGRK